MFLHVIRSPYGWRVLLHSIEICTKLTENGTDVMLVLMKIKEFESFFRYCTMRRIKIIDIGFISSDHFLYG